MLYLTNLNVVCLFADSSFTFLTLSNNILYQFECIEYRFAFRKKNNNNVYYTQKK